jgi:hypothetical protein
MRMPRGCQHTPILYFRFHEAQSSGLPHFLPTTLRPGPISSVKNGRFEDLSATELSQSRSSMRLPPASFCPCHPRTRSPVCYPSPFPVPSSSLLLTALSSHASLPSSAHGKAIKLNPVVNLCQTPGIFTITVGQGPSIYIGTVVDALSSLTWWSIISMTRQLRTTCDGPPRSGTRSGS